jgi:hypothetical protein
MQSDPCVCWHNGVWCWFGDSAKDASSQGYSRQVSGQVGAGVCWGVRVLAQ